MVKSPIANQSRMLHLNHLKVVLFQESISLTRIYIDHKSVLQQLCYTKSFNYSITDGGVIKNWLFVNQNETRSTAIVVTIPESKPCAA